MDHDKLEIELIRDEGLRLTAYRDSLGYFTIGVGHLLGNSPRMTSITADEAKALYQWDVAQAEKLARGIFPNFGTLSDARQRALTNMAFNLGGRLQGFVRFIAAITAQDWTTAGREMADSTWAKQVGQRAVRLRAMIESGA